MRLTWRELHKRKCPSMYSGECDSVHASLRSPHSQRSLGTLVMTAKVTWSRLGLVAQWLSYIRHVQYYSGSGRLPGSTWLINVQLVSCHLSVFASFNIIPLGFRHRLGLLQGYTAEGCASTAWLCRSAEISLHSIKKCWRCLFFSKENQVSSALLPYD